MTALRTAGIILAAGASTRMGRNKMLLAVDGAPMVRRAVQQATDAGLTPVVVVLGHDADAARAALAGLNCTFVTNSDYTGPTSTSLHAGLGALGEEIDAVVVMLADMVRVTAPMITVLVASAETSTAPLGVSRYDDVLAPPLLFRRALWPELLAWQGEGCGKAVVRAHQSEAVMHDWPAAALQDIDTPADYAAIVSRA